MWLHLKFRAANGSVRERNCQPRSAAHLKQPLTGYVAITRISVKKAGPTRSQMAPGWDNKSHRLTESVCTCLAARRLTRRQY